MCSESPSADGGWPRGDFSTTTCFIADQLVDVSLSVGGVDAGSEITFGSF
jgi:hypothetical protein